MINTVTIKSHIRLAKLVWNYTHIYDVVNITKGEQTTKKRLITCKLTFNAVWF